MKKDRVEWVSELSETFGQMVYHAAYRILGSPEDAEDVLQEVFLKLLSGSGKRIHPEAVKNWGAYLRVTASRTAIDLLRRKPKYKEESWEFVRETEVSNGRTPRYLASQKQKARFLRQALSQLSERDAKVFALRCFEELSYENIAEHMSISVNQVGVILHRSRERLKEILKPMEEPVERRAPGARDRSELRKEIHHV